MKFIISMVGESYLFIHVIPDRNAALQKQTGNTEAFESAHHFGHSP
jgi:hypothetical protein